MHLRGCVPTFQAGVWPERPAGRSGLKGRPDRPGWPSATLVGGTHLGQNCPGILLHEDEAKATVNGLCNLDKRSA